MTGYGFQQVRWSRLAQPGDPLAVSCDIDGPSIGPVRLLKRSADGLEPRSAAELDFILGKALGYPAEFSDRIIGLKSIVSALEKGDLARAMLVTQFMWLPSLPDDNAVDRAIKADALAKAGFNPSEPRDDRGRWSVSGSSAHDSSGPARGSDPNFIPVQEVITTPVMPWLEQILPVRPLPSLPPFPGEVMPPPAVEAPSGAVPQALPRTLENPYPEDPGCSQEWKNATEYCRELAMSGQLGTGNYSEHGKYFAQCVRGQVSERCGGSPVERGPRKPKGGKWYQWPDSEYVRA
jgi:hypothetical protein